MNKTFLLLLLFLGVFFMSCRTSKDLVYLNNTNDLELLQGMPIDSVEYTVKINDNLYIDIQSMSPDADAAFNTTKSPGTVGSMQQNYGQPSTQYLNGFLVDHMGNISLPVIGKLTVVGKTMPETIELIQKKADEYFKDATVKVKLLNFKVTILGEVKKPGVYFDYSNNITVLDGIGMANGITDFGRIQKVLVVRSTSKGAKTFRLDLTDKNFFASEAYFLQPNDVVYVEPDKYKNIKLNSATYSLILSTISTLILILNIMK